MYSRRICTLAVCLWSLRGAHQIHSLLNARDACVPLAARVQSNCTTQSQHHHRRDLQRPCSTRALCLVGRAWRWPDPLNLKRSEKAAVGMALLRLPALFHSSCAYHEPVLLTPTAYGEGAHSFTACSTMQSACTGNGQHSQHGSCHPMHARRIHVPDN